MIFGLNLAPLGPLLAPLWSLGWLGGVGWTHLDYCKYQRFRADAFILHHVLLCYARDPFWDPLRVLQIPCIWAFGCHQGTPRDPLGASWSPRGLSPGDPWCLSGFPGLALEPLWGLPGGLPEPLWGLLVPPQDSSGALWVLPGELLGLPGGSLGAAGDSRDCPGTPWSLFEVSWGHPGDSSGTPWVLLGSPGTPHGLSRDSPATPRGLLGLYRVSWDCPGCRTDLSEVSGS